MHVFFLIDDTTVKLICELKIVKRCGVTRSINFSSFSCEFFLSVATIKGGIFLFSLEISRIEISSTRKFSPFVRGQS